MAANASMPGVPTSPMPRDEQLTPAQQAAYASSAAKYRTAHGMPLAEAPAPEVQNLLLLDALSLLAEYVDAVESQRYLLLFASIVQELQDRGVAPGPGAIRKKTAIFLTFLKSPRCRRTEDTLFEHLLDRLYRHLGFSLLEGEEFPQNEHAARLMFEILRKRGQESAAEPMLKNFSMGPDGKWYFAGNRL